MYVTLEAMQRILFILANPLKLYCRGWIKQMVFKIVTYYKHLKITTEKFKMKIWKMDFKKQEIHLFEAISVAENFVCED